MKLPQIYIEEFKSSGGGRSCASCRSPSQKSLCDAHLRLAASKFRAWTHQRQLKGLCVLCEKNGDPVVNPKTGRKHSGVKCAFHRGINAHRCRTWARENGRRVFEERKAAGLCAAAPGHGAAAPGHVYCGLCRQRQKAWRKNFRAPRASLAGS